MNIRIDWVEPTNNGYAVDDYVIEIETSTTNVYVEETSLCDGSHPTT